MDDGKGRRWSVVGERGRVGDVCIVMARGAIGVW